MRALIIRHQVVAPDRPSAVRHPVTLLKVVRTKRTAEPAPAGRAATKVTGPCLVEIFIVQPDIVALVERLHCPIPLELSGFKQNHAKRLTVKFPRQADSSRTCTDNAYISFQGRPSRHVICVDDQVKCFPKKREWPLCV